MNEADAVRLIKPYLTGILTNEATKDTKKRQLQEFFASGIEAKIPTLMNYGLKVDPKSFVPAETKTMNGVPYVKVQGGWQRAK